MKKVKKRALMCLLLGLVLLGGICFFVYEDWNEGNEWVVYEGNRDVFANGDLAKGGLYDVNGELLMKNTSDGMKFNDDSSIRTACMHITGDRDNNISTGANRAFLDKMIGYDFINGIYSLNNEGENITLTLDSGICAVANSALAGRKGTVGVYNYKTGEIVCMVSSPSYDPENVPYTIPDGAYINRFTSATFTPGSVFKLLTAAASIENLSDAFSYEVNCTGKVDYGHGDEVTDLTAHGTVSLEKALEVSCNCYFGKLSEKLGAGLIKKYVEKTGLTKSYDIDGIETEASTFSYPEGGVALAWTGIGQWHDMVNPCAMMVYMGAVANDGTAVFPKIISPDNIVEKKVSEAKTAVLKTDDMLDDTTAQALARMMRNNVENHYGGENAFPGLNLCAKSGTAEVGSGKPNAWFVGFMNDENNPYAFVVMVENGGYGSEVAGSVANTVLQALKK
ncbi:MAG: penicillin-binding transpeptidase domain-containing protein [Bacillota bacterium]|nr:penicillin-binding transpeptidase domain-containing protein [Bacillota bacterium]